MSLILIYIFFLCVCVQGLRLLDLHLCWDLKSAQAPSSLSLSFGLTKCRKIFRSSRIQRRGRGGRGGGGGGIGIGGTVKLKLRMTSTSSSASASSSSSSSPCAACKLLRRKCTPECVFAPHFPPDQPAKFANVHRVFGASNVAKLLKQLRPEQREDAVLSLSYEAEARLRDPVNGCVGYIHLLQRRLSELQHDLSLAEKELSNLVTSAAAGHHLVGLPQYALPPSFPNFAGAAAANGFAGQTAINAQPAQAEVLYDRMGGFRVMTASRLPPAAQLSNSAATIGAFLEHQPRQLQQHHNSDQAQAKSRNTTGLGHS